MNKYKYNNTKHFKSYKEFMINEIAGYGVLDNSFIKELLKDSGLSYEMSEEPDLIAFNVMSAITIFRHDYNENHPFIHYLNELGNQFEYTPPMGLSHDALEGYELIIYDELVNNIDSYKDKFSNGLYESKINEEIEPLNGENYEIKNVHISTIKPEDTVKHNGVIKTVGSKDILFDDFIGHTLFGDSYKLGKTPVKKITYLVNEGIDSEALTPEQKEAYEELRTSNVELFDDRDYEHYANKIGVNIEDVIEFVMHNNTQTNNTQTNNTEEDETEILFRNRIQSDIIDNPKVDNVNLMIKLEELADELYMVMYTNIDMDYNKILDKLKDLHKEMTHNVNHNVNQIEIEFESKKINKKVMEIKKFNENWDITETETEEQIAKVSDILNETGAYDKIAEELGIEIDADSVIFREIEEFIVTMYKEMQDNTNAE